MVEQFARYADTRYSFWADPALTPRRHFLTCWVDLAITANGVTPPWPAGWLYGTTQTSLNVYSTLYFKDEPYNRRLVKKSLGSYYVRYLCPPLPATMSRDTVPQTGIPAGRNWQFLIDTQNVWVESTENKARAAAATAEFAPRPPEPVSPPVVGPGALDPGSRGLRSLRALRWASPPSSRRSTARSRRPARSTCTLPRPCRTWRRCDRCWRGWPSPAASC